MISIMGKLVIAMALLFSLLQSVLPVLGYYRKNPYLIALARPSAYAQFIFIAIAYGLLTYGFVINDFSITYVAENSHASLPFIYKLTAVWGAHEGSILLWIVLLNSWTVFFIRCSHSIVQKDLAVLTIAVLGLISFCFLSFLLLTSNPFLSALLPSSGQDLNPLLQDPGFVIHPPILYAGYVGFAVPFAMTQAALISQKLPFDWIVLIRRFVLAPWCFLTLGITLGSWWAYRVLGWGGFWFWDPVENASLLPWLSGTALIHILVLTEKRNIVKTWAILLAIITFTLSLLGTFLVRSGVLISAHTFANDPARGIFLLILLSVVVIAALLLYVIRIPTFTSSSSFALLSRETGLLLNSAFLFVAMLTILLGTLYPLILEAFHLRLISVGAPYFNSVMLPIVFFIMIAMAFTPLCRWEKEEVKKIWTQLWKKILISFFISLMLLMGLIGKIEFVTFVSLGLSIWIMLSVVPTFRQHLGMSIAHIGFAILIIGILFSSLLNEEKEVRTRPGQSIHLGPYQFFFLETKSIKGPNYRGIRTTFDVVKNKNHVTFLTPEKRIYNVREMVMTKVAIHPGIFRDLYLALGEPLEGNDWSLRLYYKPFIRFIWLGGIIMALGGLLTILSRLRQRYVI